MSQLDFHNISTFKPPPREVPSVIVKIKESYSFWIIVHRDFPKTERFGIGKRIDELFLWILELSFTASYLPAGEKIIMLGKTISRLDILKFFLQTAWENKLIQSERYIELSKNLEEIGRMLGGWKKGLQKKTPAKQTGENQQVSG